MKLIRLGQALALAVLSPIVWAAAPPDAGQLLETIKPPPRLPADSGPALLDEPPTHPAMALPSDIQVFVNEFRISGTRAFPEQDLAPLLKDAEGKEWRLADLQGLADRLTRYYRERGYMLARAYIPAQEIRDGIVKIAVLEGRLGKVNLENHSRLDDATVARQMSGLREGEAVDGKQLERTLLLLNDLPGVEVRSTLKPGASVGLTELDLTLADGRPFNGSVELDNFGNRYTGSARAGATLNLNSLAGWGDALTLRGITSGEGMNYGRVAYQLPIGTLGTRAGIAWSQMGYRLGKDFRSLEAHGEADIATAYVLQPLLRSRRTNLNAQLAFDHKHLDDRVDATATVTRKNLDVWTLGLSGDHVDGLAGGGVSQYSVAVVYGDLRLDAESAALDAAGLRTEGHYSKLAYQATRIQRLTEAVSLKGQVAGQAAAQNLDSSEKFTLGGAYGVRAYPQGEGAADDAWLLSLELRYALASDWQWFGFYDAGNGRISHHPVASTAHNTAWLSGAGLGLAWGQEKDFTLQAYAAWRTAAAPISDLDRSPRFWLQAIKHF